MKKAKLTPAQVARLRRAPVSDTPNKVALAMKLAAVTQDEIAAATDFDQTYISRIKNGRYSSRGLPGETMRTMAEYFGCQIEDLFPAREAIAS